MLLLTVVGFAKMEINFILRPAALIMKLENSCFHIKSSMFLNVICEMQFNSWEILNSQSQYYPPLWL